MTTSQTKEDTMFDLRDSDTADTVTAEQLGIDDAEYEQLVRDSRDADNAEGHVRTSTGRRVYADAE
jgi:hypothetical protein